MGGLGVTVGLGRMLLTFGVIALSVLFRRRSMTFRRSVVRFGSLRMTLLRHGISSLCAE